MDDVVDVVDDEEEDDGGCLFAFVDDALALFSQMLLESLLMVVPVVPVVHVLERNLGPMTK